MIPRVQNAVHIKEAIEKAGSRLTKIGFDASVLEEVYIEIQEDYTHQSLTPDSDESTLHVTDDSDPIDKTQMVRLLSNYRFYV